MAEDWKRLEEMDICKVGKKMHTENNNIFKHEGTIDYAKRCALLNQRGIILWFTGLSGSGKSTIAVAVENELNRLGKLAYRLDGDNLRLGLNAGLGFSSEDRLENNRRVAEVAALFTDAGIITLVSFISPLRSMREYARSRISDGMFAEVYVKADIEICIQRDPKGLYQKALDGKITDMTGISSPYEEPLCPDLILDTGVVTIEEALNDVMSYLRTIGCLNIK